MGRITVDMIMDWKSCPEYPRERVEGLFAGREALTVQEVFDLGIPHAHRLCGVLHPGIFNDSQLRLLGVKWARRALLREQVAGRDPDPRSWVACRVAERFANSEATGLELTVAWVAARCALMNTKCSTREATALIVAHAAARCAARDCVEAADWDVEVDAPDLSPAATARIVGRNAVQSAVGDAAKATEEAMQRADILEITQCSAS